MYSILSLSVCIDTAKANSSADQRTTGAEKLEGRLVDECSYRPPYRGVLLCENLVKVGLQRYRGF